MWQKLVWVAVICGSCFFAGCVANPITGEEELMFFPDQQDIEIGRQYAPEIEKELKGRVKDQSVQNYIDSVGQKVAHISHRPDFDFHFVAVNDKSINAVSPFTSLPGTPRI
jgi:predicted Zn-dependent protease